MIDRLLAFIVIAVAAVVLFVSCGDESSGTGDGPVGKYNDSPSYILNFPDEFENVAIRCVGGSGIYTTTRDSPPVVIVNDPLCKEGGFYDHLGLSHNPDRNVNPNGGDK